MQENKRVDVVFCGWQENGDGRSILLVTEFKSNSTVVYDPERHKGLNVKGKHRDGNKGFKKGAGEEGRLIKILKGTLIEREFLIKQLIEDGLAQNRVIIKLKRELKWKESSEIDIRGLRCL